MKRSDSSDSDSVALTTPLTTPIFDFHYVLSALSTPLTTPTPTPTPSLVKTGLKYSLPSQWVPVLAPAYSLPLTGRIGVHTTLRFLFRDRRGAASELRDRNRGPTTAQICEQKSYPGMIFVALQKLFGIVPQRAAFVCSKLDNSQG